MLTDLFLLGVTAEELRANIDRKSFLKGAGPLRPHFHVEGDIPHQPFLQ